MAWYIYGLKHNVNQKLAKLFPKEQKMFEQKYYVDEFYNGTVVWAVKNMAKWVSNWIVEQLLVNRLVETTTKSLFRLAKTSQKLQTGFVRAYLVYVVMGAAFLIYLMLH